MDFTIGPWKMVTQRVYLAKCEPVGVNIGLIVGTDHVLMVDAGGHPEQGRRLAAAAAEVAGQRVDHLVVTHWHWDHWFGARGVGADTVVGHVGLEHRICDSRLGHEATQWGMDPAGLLLPNHLISLVKAIDLGGVRVEIVHLGGAHTDTDLMVLVPGENVIFTGDLLEQGADPQFDDSSEIGTWPSVLDGALGAANDDTIFIPGHGTVVDRMFAFRQRAEIAMLYAEGERLARSGIQLKDATTATQWPFSPKTIAVALPLVYAELERKGVCPRRHLPLI